MTRIDRYILVLFLRTVLVCFCSLVGIFIVFHAFTSMDDLVEQGREHGGLVPVMLRFYGPYVLFMFDMTGTIITLMAFLFTVGWLRRTGELTATLSAGVSHGRLFRPMIIASVMIILTQLGVRELVLPHFRNELTMKADDMGGELEQGIVPTQDLLGGIVLHGKTLRARTSVIVQPSFKLYGDYPGFGDAIKAETATWSEATAERPTGYLLQEVGLPEQIDQLPSVGIGERLILMTHHDQDWLQPKECFVATTIGTDLLQTNEAATRMASVAELAGRIRNPAVHNSASLQVLLHQRIIRPPLDFALILLGLPLVVNRRGRNLFVMIGVAIGTVLMFFVIKTIAGALGGSGYWVSPAMAGWIPLLIIGPIAYVRFRDVQTV